METSPSATLQLLRQLPARERLSVIAQALPEATRDLDTEAAPLRSLLGILQDLGPAPGEEEIAEARRGG